MKTKQEILKMSREELSDYKLSDDLNAEESSDCPHCSYCYNCSRCSHCYNCSNCYDCSHCSHCSYCSNCSYCSYCSYCSNCSDCYKCRNVEGLRYAICNVEMSKGEFFDKMKELNKIV